VKETSNRMLRHVKRLEKVIGIDDHNDCDLVPLPPAVLEALERLHIPVPLSAPKKANRDVKRKGPGKVELPPAVQEVLDKLARARSGRAEEDDKSTTPEENTNERG